MHDLVASEPLGLNCESAKRRGQLLREEPRKQRGGGQRGGPDAEQPSDRAIERLLDHRDRYADRNSPIGDRRSRIGPEYRQPLGRAACPYASRSGGVLPQIPCGNGPDKLLVPAGPGDDPVRAVDNRCEPILRQPGLEQQRAQPRRIDPGIDETDDIAVAYYRHVDADDRPLRGFADKQVRYDRLPGRDRLPVALGQRERKRTGQIDARVDELLSRCVLYENLGTQDALYLHGMAMQRVDVALVESRGGRQHLQGRNKAKQLPIDPCRQCFGEADSILLKLLAPDLRHLPQQQRGEDKHRKQDGRNERRQMPSDRPLHWRPARGSARSTHSAVVVAGAANRIAVGACHFGGFRRLPHRCFARASIAFYQGAPRCRTTQIRLGTPFRRQWCSRIIRIGTASAISDRPAALS